MELEEQEDDNDGGKVRWVFNKGVTLGRKILVAGLVASSVPLVLPPLVVASAVGLAVSTPVAVLFACHACTENLMSKLLPRPTPQDPPLLEDVCFEQNNDYIEIDKEKQALAEEKKGDNEVADVQHMIMTNEEDVTSGSTYGEGVVDKDEQEQSNSQDAIGDIQHKGSKKDDSDYFCDEEDNASPQMHNNVTLGARIDDGMEGHQRGESNGEQPIVGGHGVVITIEGLDMTGSGNDIEEIKTPFEVTSVALEEFGDEAIEGDIDEAELQRETKGLLEKIRDEGRTESGGEYVRGIHGETKESGKNVGPVVENTEVTEEDKHTGTMVGTEGDARKEDDTKVCEETILSGNAENKDTIFDEVVSAKPIGGILEGEEVDNTNDSQKPMAEHSEMLEGRHFLSETTPAEPAEDLLIDMQDYNMPVAEDSSEVTSGNTDLNIIVKEESKPLLDGPRILQEEKSDNNISDFVNQESQLQEYNEIMDASDRNARVVADESGLNLFDGKREDPDVYAYTIDLYEESSNVMVDGHADPMEVVSSVEQELRPSECSSGKDIMCPSHEVVFNEENIWKQIHVIRKIIGYEGTIQASCADELKALYIFTGVEAPTFLNENSYDPAEVSEKLHFLMSIVGIKSNVV